MAHDSAAAPNGAYRSLVSGISDVIEEAKVAAARSVNAAMTVAYWLIGQHIVEFEQGGRKRAGYGEGVVERLAADLTARHGRGFSVRNIRQMRTFYEAWPVQQAAELDVDQKRQTPSAELGVDQKRQTASAELGADQKRQTPSAELGADQKRQTPSANEALLVAEIERARNELGEDCRAL